MISLLFQTNFGSASIESMYAVGSKMLFIFCRTMTLSGFIDAVTELVSFVGRLATEGLRLENCHILLLNHTLNFYETVMQSCCLVFMNLDTFCSLISEKKNHVI